jgi:hypothetical protein
VLTVKHLLKEELMEKTLLCNRTTGVSSFQTQTTPIPCDDIMKTNYPTTDNNSLAKKKGERECDHCKNIFSSRQSLWVHLKTCRVKNGQSIVETTQSNLTESAQHIDPTITKEYIRNEINNILASNRTILAGVLNNITTQNITTTNIMNNNTTNNVFNLSVFLNEQCKDAMNLSEFINNIEFTDEDLENCGRNGYVCGITEIFQRNLAKCGIYKRPIHCTDVKREVLHIKENDIWQKEEIGNPIMKKYVVIVGNKGVKRISSWSNKNSNAKIMDTPEYNLWLCIGKNVNNAGQDEVKNYNRVLKNVTLMTDISDIKKTICNK